MLINIDNIYIQHLPSFSTKEVTVHILRIDLLHPIVSGNKWFKLQHYLNEALSQSCTTLFSFGGAYSNHLVATAFAGKESGMATVGIVRGEATTTLSPTLREAISYGMQLIFVSRETYRNKAALIQQYQKANWYCIPEGGYGSMGAKGAADILRVTDTSKYNHIICACGTGTMFSGLVQAALPHQQVTGISVLKGHHSIEAEIAAILPAANIPSPHNILHGYDRGGYAKYDSSLLEFMNITFEKEGLPTDLVYTSKLLMATQSLIGDGYFSSGSDLLLIHSGGLQGNRSLKTGMLTF